MDPVLSTATWLELPEATRAQLRIDFSIPQTGGREVYGKRLVSDGTTPENLRAITLEKLQAYNNNSVSTDFHLLFQTTVNKIENPGLKEEVKKKVNKVAKETKKVTKKKTNAKAKKSK